MELIHPKGNMSIPNNEKTASLTRAEPAHYSHHELDRTDTHETHDDLHVHNELAHKGDDSDGHVEWTTRTIIAACSLGALYTGMAFQCCLFSHGV
jgi:hypothetical protein